MLCKGEWFSSKLDTSWKTKKVEKYVAVTKHTEKKKTEVLIFNYDPEKIKPHGADNKAMLLELERKLKQLKF